MVAGHDMLHRHVDVDFGVRLGPGSMHFHLVFADLLALLAKDRDYVHARAAGQAHEQELHWRGPLVFTAFFGGNVQRDGVPRGR